MLILFYIDFVFRHRVNGREFTLDTRELREILGDVRLDEPEVIAWIDAYLREQDAALEGTA